MCKMKGTVNPLEVVQDQQAVLSFGVLSLLQMKEFSYYNLY